MFRFWYRFVPDNIALIGHGEADLAYEQVSPQIPAYMGGVFEEICKQYLWIQNIAKQTPFMFTDAGRWWGNNPKKKSKCEIDIIADNKNDALFAECKWTNERVGTDVIDTLIERSELFSYSNKHYYLFAKTDFTDGAKAKADSQENITLLSFHNLYSHVKEGCSSFSCNHRYIFRNV